ncbi:MAG: transposase family protein, partial [bacterium]|nr:transposase family protein [bacterium]
MMKKNALFCRIKKKFVCTTNSNHAYKVYPNLIKKLLIQKLNQVWVSDITYIRLDKGFACLAIILDSLSRKVIVYAISKRIDKILTISALKMAIVAADILNDRVIPFFQEQGIPLNRIITDRGTEFCGKPDQHAFQLYLGIEDIDHTRTKAYSPQANGICERFHKTMKNECYMTLFRKKLYYSLEDLQVDVDLWVHKYNTDRPHSGKYCYGKTPFQTFLDAK